MRRRDLPYLMVRMFHDGMPSIALVRRCAGGRGHVLVWAVSFDEPFHREFLFAWLERNFLRWPIWGAMASSQGSASLSRHIDVAVEKEAMAGVPITIQIYRAAAYLGCTEDDLLAFRNREECAPLFEDEPDVMLGKRPTTFVDLGGLVRWMVEDALAKREDPE